MKYGFRTLAICVLGVVAASGVYFGGQALADDVTAPVAAAAATQAVAPVVVELKDVVATAQAAGLVKLTAAVEAAGMTKDLQAAGPFTVLGPTDEAFAVVVEKDAAQLKAILSGHVISGKMTAAEMVKAATVKTLSGATLTVKTTEDGSIMVGDAKIVKADVAASNGMVLVINKVLLPVK